MTWKTVVLQFYSFPQPLFHVGCTALPVKVKVDVPQGHLQLLVAPSTHRDWLVPAQATDFCGDELTCYFLGTRLNFSALPIPVPLLRFLPPQSPLWLERKSKRKILAASRGDHWDQWVRRRYPCASSSLTLQALVCLCIQLLLDVNLSRGLGCSHSSLPEPCLAESGNQLICFAGQSKRLGLSNCFPSSLVRGHLKIFFFPSHFVLNKGSAWVLAADEMYLDRSQEKIFAAFVTNPYSQGVKSCWAATCEILTLMGIWDGLPAMK